MVINFKIISIKKLSNVNDLVRILMSSNYNQEFLIDCLKELTEEELKKNMYRV